jgi:hypothetical protein
MVAAVLGLAPLDRTDKPLGPPPRFVVVEEADAKKGVVTYSEITMEFVPVNQVREVVEDGVTKKVTETVLVPQYKTVMVNFAVKDGQVYDGDGKKLDADEVWKRATPKTPIVLASDSRMIDAAYLKLLKKETLVFVAGAPKAK